MEDTLITVSSERSLEAAHAILSEAYAEYSYIQLKLTSGKERSLGQNKMVHALYSRAAKRENGETPLSIKNYCKLTLGVPILRAEDDDFRETWDKNIKQSLTYEQKLAIMDFFPVTSLMNTEQSSRYIEAVMAHYALEEDFV